MRSSIKLEKRRKLKRLQPSLNRFDTTPKKIYKRLKKVDEIFKGSSKFVNR